MIKLFYFLLQDMIISDISALVYFCFGIVIAVVADEWRDLEISGTIFYNGATIGNSLAATSVSYIEGTKYFGLSLSKSHTSELNDGYNQYKRGVSV